jgi:tetratricopeptide (TPR) repeat protein
MKWFRSFALSVSISMLPHSALAEDKSVQPQTEISRAVALIKQHQASEAIQILDSVIGRFDSNISEAQTKGLVFCAADPVEVVLYSGMAATQKKRGVVFGPDVCDAFFYKAYALIELGRKEEAVSTLERLTSLSPLRAQYLVELGYAYRVSGQLEKSQKAYQQAIGASEATKDKQSAKLFRAAARRGLGYLAIDRGDLDQAEKHYRQSLEDDPGSAIAKSELRFIESERQK